MKTRFYTVENIQSVAESIKTEAESYCPRINIRYDPSKSALLVIDMQNIFLKEEFPAFIPSAPVILPGIRLLVKKYLSQNRPVIFTRHLNSKDNAGMMSKWWNRLIVEEDRASEITDELDYSKSYVIKKFQYDAFIQSDLESILKSNNVTQLVICGVMTHLCCETTARSAFMKQFELFFAVDGTASYTEQLHKGAIINLAHGFAKPVMIDEIISEMDKSHGPQ